MYTTTQATAAHNIARVAEQVIKVQTGANVKLVVYPPGTTKTSVQMLQLIAATLSLEYDCYRARNRARNIVELRFIASLLMRRYYPEITLKQIGAFFGGQDHTTVINGLIRANALLKTRDFSFTYKYNKAVGAVCKWLDQQ